MKKQLHRYGNALINGIKEMGLISLLTLGLSPTTTFATSYPDFWLAERGPQKIWLLGSIHVGQDDMYPLAPIILQSWQHAENLIVETDLSPSADSSKILTHYALLPPHTTLVQRLNKALYQKTIDVAAQYQLDEPSLAHFRPWFVAMTLQQQAIQQAGYQASFGIDQYFIDQAHNQQLTITYLETPEQQIAYLAGLGDMEGDFLNATLQQIDKVHEELPMLIKAWESGDRVKIQSLLDDESDSPQLKQYLEQHLIQERNQHWLPQMTSLSFNRNFMVVGAMHLYGEHGLLKLLENNGYKITNIQSR